MAISIEQITKSSRKGKYSLLLFAVLFCANAFAQRSVEGMIQAEKNFANTALVASTREAFMKFIDTAGIVFEQGNPVNGLQLYKKSERRPGILTWEPEYAEIASTNDFGYTTGPWKYYSNNIKEAPVVTGYFVTVWHLTNRNDWKFLIDFGITCQKENKKTALKKKQAEHLSSKGSQPLCTDAEEKFIQAYTAQGAKAYNCFLSSQSRINYRGFLPATTPGKRKMLLDSLPANIKYTILGSGMSRTKDLGYVYGSSVINGKQDGYLRIWRKEKNGWQIAVEVLHMK